MSAEAQPTTLVRTRWEIRPRDDSLPVRGDLRALPDHSPRTAVVICHGFKGFREWGFFPALARAVARRGHAAISFDFSHNGVGDDGVDFSALDRFASSTHSRNVDEIRLVLDATASPALFARPPERIGLIGHSRGGAEALLASAEDERVDALVTWSAFASIPDRWNLAQVAKWKRGKTVWIENARTGQQMPVGPDYWRDAIEHRERLDLLGRAARLRIPWLILHGEADETVSCEDARTLAGAAGDNAELRIVEEGSHTFGATHPFGGATTALRTAVDTTLSWLDARLA